jgi:hypothetical protein
VLPSASVLKVSAVALSSSGASNTAITS